MIVIFFRSRPVFGPPLVPVKNGRDKREVLLKTYKMSKGYKGIMQTSIIIICLVWIINSIKMSWHTYNHNTIYHGLGKIWFGS